MNKREIFITGATGFIGQHLVNFLLGKGEKISILTRNPDKVPSEWKDRVLILKGDLSDEGFSLPENLNVIFHLAGEINDTLRLEKSNIIGTRNIVKACLKHKGCNFIYLSSVGVMGTNFPGFVDENIDCFPRNMYEKTKYEAEKIVQDAVKDFGLNALILRPSIVYGQSIAQEKDSFLGLIRAVRKRKVCFFGNKTGYYNIVYVGDVVEALNFLSKLYENPQGDIFIINDYIPWPDFIRMVSSALKISFSFVKVPILFGYTLALLCQIMQLMGIKMPFSLSRFKVLTCKTIFDSNKIKEAGFRFKYSNSKGIAITLNDYFKKGLL